MMPRAANSAARLARDQAIRADRARGWSLRKLAAHHGLSLSNVHRVAGHVPIALPGPWHLARMPRQAPGPVLPLVHRYLARQ